jgi:hypothetical protein
LIEAIREETVPIGDTDLIDCIVNDGTALTTKLISLMLETADIIYWEVAVGTLIHVRVIVG